MRGYDLVPEVDESQTTYLESQVCRQHRLLWNPYSLIVFCYTHVPLSSIEVSYDSFILNTFEIPRQLIRYDLVPEVDESQTTYLDSQVSRQHRLLWNPYSSLPFCYTHVPLTSIDVSYDSFILNTFDNPRQLIRYDLVPEVTHPYTTYLTYSNSQTIHFFQFPILPSLSASLHSLFLPYNAHPNPNTLPNSTS